TQIAVTTIAATTCFFMSPLPVHDLGDRCDERARLLGRHPPARDGYAAPENHHHDRHPPDRHHRIHRILLAKRYLMRATLPARRSDSHGKSGIRDAEYSARRK